MSDFFDEVLTDPTARWAFEDSRARNELLDSLVSARRMLGLTQDNVAERMGVGQPTVSEFESEGSNPRLATVQRYARAMGARVVFGLILPPPNWQAGDE